MNLFFVFHWEAPGRIGILLHINLETVHSNGSWCMHFWRLASSFVTELKHPDQCELFYWQIHPAMMEVPRYQVTSWKWRILLQKVRMPLLFCTLLSIKELIRCFFLSSRSNMTKFQFDPGMHGHFWTSSCELHGAPWVNKLHIIYFFISYLNVANPRK